MDLLDICTIIASTAAVLLTIVGSCCGFMKWMLEASRESMNQRLDMIENTMENLEKDVHTIAEDVKDQRKRTDQLFEILINSIHTKK